MKTRPDAKDPSVEAVPLDPVVNELARRVRASSLPEARALVPLSAEERRALTDRLLGPAEEAMEQQGRPGEAPRRAPDRPPVVRRLPSPREKKPPEVLPPWMRAPSRLEPGVPLPSFGPKLAPPAQAPARAEAVAEKMTPASAGVPAPLPHASLVPPNLQPAPAPEAKNPRAWRWWPVALAAAFVLVAAFLWFRPGGQPSSPVAYALLAQGDMSDRGEPPPDGVPLRLRPSTRLLVVLSPKEPVPDAVLRMLVVRGGKARLVRPPYENDGQGKLTIDKPARDALGDQENGPAELVWVVGGPMPEDATLERIALDPKAVPPRGTAVLRRAALFAEWGSALRTAPEDIEFTGCKAMIRGPRCEMDPGAKLVLWTPWEAREGAVQADGEPVKVEIVPVAAGTRWTLAVKAGTRQITLSSPHLESPFQVSTIDAPSVPAITEASRLLDANQLPDAEKVLAAMADDTPYAKIAGLRLMARIARRRGNAAQAESLFREAISKASAEGRLSDEIESRHVLALQAMAQHRDYAAAEEELAAARLLEAQCPPWRMDGAYYRGALAQERGRYAEALAAFSTVRQSAARLDLPDMEGAVLQPLAEMLSIWGRDEEAVDLLKRAYSLSPDNPCARGRVLTNWAWAEYRAAGTKSAHERAASRAEEALHLLGGSPCGPVLATAQMNAALAQAAAGRTKDARSALAQIRATVSGNARMAPWMARLELDLDRAEDPARALETAARLEREMKENTMPELAFEAALGRATALDALDRPEEASLAYEEAARRETEWAAKAPLGEGRALFFERQRSAFRAWVDFAVRRAEHASPSSEEQSAAAGEVARVMRRSLGRFFATLLPRSSAPPPNVSSPALAKPVGEVDLYYHPIRDGWAAVAVSALSSPVVKRLPVIPRSPPADLAAALLAPFKGVVEGARRVVVLADRTLRDIAFEDLPWEGGVLSDHVAVAYGTGVQARASGPAPRANACTSKPFALLVLDPSRNLGNARRVGEHIAARLGSGAAVLAGERATRGAVMDALSDPCTRLFQYDGHAVFGKKKDGIEAALSLADGPLTTSELLDRTALGRVPEVVVLSGCETAREEGMGVANAFLERGSRQVLATTAKVDDALSGRLMEALYEPGPPAGAEWDLAVALQAAVRSLRGPGAGAGPWAPFRVLVL